MGSVNGKLIIRPANKRNKRKAPEKSTRKEYISGAYSCAIGMSRWVHKFPALPWWAEAEQKYNRSFGTDHTKLQDMVKEES